MQPTFSIKIGNFLFKNFFSLYKFIYWKFKKRQDSSEISLMKSNIHEGDVVMDIGANIGFYTTLFSEMVGVNGKVHAFEPDAVNFNYLLKETQGKINVTKTPKAVSSKSSVIKLYRSKELNVDHRTYQPEEYESVQEIQAVSIDDYFNSDSAEFSRVDFIKMDIQGFEMEAIKGMEKTIRSNPGLKMIAEFWPYGLRKSGYSALAFFQLIESFGFEMHLISKSKLELLTKERVIAMDDLEEPEYFNVFLKRKENS
jgi:FkbM family methyltransferase